MNSGWIKLHRKLIDWEWYNDVNTTRVFLHLLLVANHKDNKWRGINIKRGQKLTSISALADETNLSIKNIRTSIKRLKATNEVASHSNAQHTVFTMINYDLYQEVASEVANEGQAKGKQGATNKNDKNENNVNKDIFNDQFDMFWQGYPRKVNKPAAKKTFKATLKDLKLKKEGVIEFIEFIHKDCIKRFDGRDSKYIPHASSYLNSEGWKDEF